MWTKISGADRLTEAGAPYEDVDPFAAALLRANSARIVWGSDWPHINYFGGGVPRDLDLVRALLRWTEGDMLRRILVDNPAELYDFVEARATRSGHPGPGFETASRSGGPYERQ